MSFPSSPSKELDNQNDNIPLTVDEIVDIENDSNYNPNINDQKICDHDRNDRPHGIKR